MKGDHVEPENINASGEVKGEILKIGKIKCRNLGICKLGKELRQDASDKEGDKNGGKRD
jgi:hypothetical protein